MVVVGRTRSIYRPAQAAFTLVEMLVVLLLIGLLSATLLGNLNQARSGNLSREADRLAALLREAALQARATGTPMAWRPADGRYDFVPAALVDQPEAAGLPGDPRRPVYRLDDEVRILSVRNGESPDLKWLIIAGRGIAAPAIITLAVVSFFVIAISGGIQ